MPFNRRVPPTRFISPKIQFLSRTCSNGNQFLIEFRSSFSVRQARNGEVSSELTSYRPDQTAVITKQQKRGNPLSAFIRLPFLHEHHECNNLERASYLSSLKACNFKTRASCSFFESREKGREFSHPRMIFQSTNFPYFRREKKKI